MIDYRPITENGRFVAAYIEPHNPHLTLIPISPKGANRTWKCQACELTGSFEFVNSQPCTAPMPPPCAGCGLTPICARDCPGIRKVLSGDGVYVIDGQG